MPLFDLPLEELWDYAPDVLEPADFDAFWATTLAEARVATGPLEIRAVDAGLQLVETFDIVFPGFGGHPIRGWLLLPTGSGEARLPAVVEYNGYGGGRGLPHERLAWVAAGYAYFFMDTRGQGSMWGSGGDTPDPVGAAPSAAGFVTRGILDPEQYYYRRVFTDAVRAIDMMRSLDRVDPDAIAVCGGSQGGGIALAAAGLVPGLRAAMPEVPFLSHFRRGVEVSPEAAYGEIGRYLSVHRRHVDAVFSTLSYFDGVHFARRATAPGLFSVGLMDPVCPPSTVFAAYNAYAAPKAIEIYPFNEHEGGHAYHWSAQATWLAGLSGPSRIAPE